MPTKSGLMLGLGETNEEVIQVMEELRTHEVDMLTLGQYLQPSRAHLVDRFVHPDEFSQLKATAQSLGFSQVASGPWFGPPITLICRLKASSNSYSQRVWVASVFSNPCTLHPKSGDNPPRTHRFLGLA